MEDLLREHSPKVTRDLSGDSLTSKTGKKKIPAEPEDELDLHNGRSSEECLREFEEFLLDCLKRNLRKIRVITGKGLHSPGGRAVLSPKIEKLIEEFMSFKVIERYKKESGHFDVILPDQ